ncbi:MAG: HEAT repeat domain-containing protein [Planctomycetota bacterium]
MVRKTTKTSVFLAFLALCQAFPASAQTGGKNDALKVKVAEVLSLAVGEDVQRRRTAVERLVALGPDAVSTLADCLDRGNHHAVRAVVIALGEIADETSGQALAKYFTKIHQPGEDTDIAVVAAYGMGACPGQAATDALIAIVESGAEEVHVRASAALGLARRSDRSSGKISALFTKLSKRGDSDPEVLAGLLLAIARSDPSLATSKIPGLLKDITDPAARAACWLSLSIVKKPGPAAAAEPDLGAADFFVKRFAILGIGDVPKKGDSSPDVLREAKIISLAIGAADPKLAALAASEFNEELRRTWNGAFAERGWAPSLVTTVWKEKEIGENGRFAAAALLALRGGFSAEEKVKLAAQAKERWKADVTTAIGAALLLASIGDKDSEALLAPDNTNPEGKRPPAARLAWKRLRGELDQRRFEQAVFSFANSERVLPAGWISDAERALAAAILGQGSHFFINQKKLLLTPKTFLPPGLNRRKRSLPEEHPMYADLWFQLWGTPFDAMLIFPRDENG